MLSFLIERLKTLSLVILTFIFLCFDAYSESFEEPSIQDHYQIEFIVFKHLNADKTVLKYEDHAPLKIDFSIKEQTFLTNSFAPLVVSQKESLSIDEMILKESNLKLSKSIATRVLNVSAWIQAIENDTTLPPLFIFKELAPNNNDTNTSIYSRLEGQAVIKRSRYLHAKFDLAVNQYIDLPYATILDWFFDDDPFPTNWLTQKLQVSGTYLDNKGSSSVLLNSIKLLQSRRIKDGEIHYIDHPLLGVITTIKKLEPISEYESF